MVEKDVNIFEAAARGKFRFPYKGMITAEDLWDLPLEALDSIFKTLNAKAKKAQEESLLDTKSKEDEETLIKIAVIRRVVEVKKQEQLERVLAAETREKRRRILAILADRDDEELRAKSRQELEDMLKGLG